MKVTVEMPWYIGLNPWIRWLQVRFPSMPGTFVLQQDILSALLLSTQVYKWVPSRMRTLFICRLIWYVCAPEVAHGQNTPQGVEKVHYMSTGLILNPMTGGNNTL